MKILFIGPNPNTIGGVQKHIRTLIQSLNTKKIDSIIVCPKGETQIQELDEKYIRSIPMFLRPFTQLFLLPKFIFHIINNIKEFNPDIIHIHHSIFYSLASLIVKKIFKIKTVVTLHGHGIKYPFGGTILDKIVMKIIVKNEIILYNSRWIKKEIPTHFISKAIFFPTQLMSMRKVKRINSLHNTQKVILFIFRYDVIKGLTIIKQIIDNFMNQEAIHFHLIIAGNEELIAKWISSIQNKNISYQMNLPSAKLDEYISNSKIDLFIEASQHNGLTYTMLELMARKVPIMVINDWDKSPFHKYIHYKLIDLSSMKINEIKEEINAILYSQNHAMVVSAYNLLNQKFNTEINILKLIKIYTKLMKD